MTRILSWLRSPKFFYIVIASLVLPAAWIALSARYPQAFDENYHLGLIKLHAEQWLPFFTSQPPGDALYGALARDPSYLYHFLMSLPYRLLAGLTDSLATQVIVLRFINIGIFVGGLFVYRRLLRELDVSPALSHVVLLFFVLLPIVPLLAGQINYDNLMFLLCGLLFVAVVRFYKILQQGKLPVVQALLVLAYGTFGSLVKFPFAPIFAAAVAVLAFLIWRAWRRGKLPKNWRSRLWPANRAAKTKLVVLGVTAAIGLILCFERYGVNLLQYHSPVPKCDKVLSVDACLSYSPWARDHRYAATYPRPTLHGIAVYPGVWFHRVVFETMFTITSTYWEDSSPNRTIVYYYAADPLTVANYTAWTVVTVGCLAALWYWRRLWHMTALRLLLLIIGFYTVVLFAQNFAMYLHSGEAVAIHGRYFIPVFPVILLVLALASKWLLEQFRLQRFQMWLLVVVFVLFLQGAGANTWIVRSQEWWYWPQSAAAKQVNWWAHTVLEKLTID